MTKHVEGQTYVGEVQSMKTNAPKYDSNGCLKEESAIVATIRFPNSEALVTHIAALVAQNEPVEVSIEPVQRALDV